MPSSFRILRSLLSRLEDEATGEIKPSELPRADPARPHRRGQGRRGGAGRRGLVQVPVRPRHAAGGRRSGRADPEPHLAPGPRRSPASKARRISADAGNVLRPGDGRQAVAAPAADRSTPRSRRQAAEGTAGSRSALRREGDASTPEQPGHGWNAPALAPWLRASIDRASQGRVRPRRRR